MPGGAAPFGAWPSPVTPESLAAGSVRITTLVADGGDLWWSETRPAANGRTVLMRRSADGSVREMTPPDANVRSRVHSYGGGAWWVADGVCVYSDDSDFRLRRVGADDGEPVVLTPEGADRSSLYADGRLSVDGQWFVCVRERSAHPENVNEIVSVALDGSGRVEVAVAGADFYSDPRPSPCGRRLAWLQWDHPNMPWDGCELHVGRLEGPTVAESRRVAGGLDEWIFGPAWHDGGPNWVNDGPGSSTRSAAAPHDVDPSWLTWVSDGSGWSTLWVLEGDPLAADALPRLRLDLPDGEIQTAPWVFGMSRYAVWSAAGDRGGLACAAARRGGHELRLVGERPGAAGVGAADAGTAESSEDPGDARSGTATSGLAASPYPRGARDDPGDVRSGSATVAGASAPAVAVCRAHTSFGALRAWEGGVVCVAGSPSVENEILHVTGAGAAAEARVVYSPPALRLDRGFTPEPEPVTFPTTGGDVAHGWFYRPANPDVAGEGAGAPPLLVMAHGGPTGAARTALHLGLRYWTSRGIAVVDVDYRGSTGYGRAYRRALDGGWGVTDVADCVAAARHLAERGEADGDRLAMIGASAGGYAVLQAVTEYDVFSAGLIRYGVTDLEALARDTHKFEKHYMDRLVGPYPAEKDLYVARSPIHRAERISCPMLILQGDSDPVVPPQQAETLVAALEASGLPYAYLLFEGEAHGFRGAEAIVAAAAAELSFLGQIFGFEPAGNISPVAVRNL